jgi:hypothetical protein
MIRKLGLSIFIMLLISIDSCTEKTPQIDKNESIKIEITKGDIKETRKVNEIFDTLWKVPLESNLGNMISSINRIYIQDSILYILDLKQDIIFIFNISGKYISKIDNKGKGPKQYINVDDIYINDDKELIICDIANRKLIHYSALGDFLFEEKNPINNESFYCMTELSNGNLFYYIGQKNSSNKLFKDNNAVILNDKKLVPLFPNLQGELKIKARHMDSYICNTKKETFLHIPFHNELYEISENQIRIKYSINILNKNIPDEAFFSQSTEYFLNKYVKDENYITMIGPIKVSEDFITTYLMNGPKFYGNLWISRKTNRSLVVNKIIYEQGKHLELVTKCVKGDTMICTTIGGNPTDINSNPVLTMYRLRKF